MLRDPSLIPLSRQHQHALALCVRMERATQAGNVELEAWQSEIQQAFEQEIRIHFAAEEKELFPRAAQFPELSPLVDELVKEHAFLRDRFAWATARAMSAEDLQGFAEGLSAHIRKEERQLFEGMQKVMLPEELLALGVKLEEALREASSGCAVHSEATRLRGRAEVDAAKSD